MHKPKQKKFTRAIFTFEKFQFVKNQTPRVWDHLGEILDLKSGFLKATWRLVSKLKAQTRCRNSFRMPRKEEHVLQLQKAFLGIGGWESCWFVGVVPKPGIIQAGLQ